MSNHRTEVLRVGLLRGPQWAVLGGIGWYLGVIRKGDREPGRGRSTKGIQFVGSTEGVIKEAEIENYTV